MVSGSDKGMFMLIMPVENLPANGILNINIYWLNAYTGNLLKVNYGWLA